MATFISQRAPEHFYPTVGQHVIGATRKKYEPEVEGVVLPSRKNPRKPAIFSRYGAVLLYIRTEDGREICVNNVRPSSRMEQERAAFESRL